MANDLSNKVDSEGIGITSEDLDSIRSDNVRKVALLAQKALISGGSYEIQGTYSEAYQGEQ